MNLTRTLPDARRHDLAFWSVAFAFLAVMAFSTVPSPLYGLYQQRDGFSSFVITLIYAAYAVGVVSSLIFAGHISDWHGRRRVLLPAIAITIVSALVFLVWRDLPGLIVARIINGFSVGIVTATATAYLADLHTAAHPGTGNRRSQVVATVVNVGGLGLGPLIAGLLAQWVGSPLTVPYAVFVVALVIAFALVAVAPDPHTTPNPRPPYRIQRLAVPAEARGAFFAAAVGAFVAFGVLGLFTGLASTFLIGTLHQPSHALAGFTVFAMFAAGVVVQIATLSWAVRRVLSLGIALMLLGLALTVLAVWLPTPSLALLLIGGAVSGAGGGAVFKGAVGTVIEVSPADTRAEALAGLFLAGYLGLSFPALGAGVALQYVSARDTLLGFAVIVGIGIVATASRLLGSETPPAALAANGA